MRAMSGPNRISAGSTQFRQISDPGQIRTDVGHRSDAGSVKHKNPKSDSMQIRPKTDLNEQRHPDWTQIKHPLDPAQKQARIRPEPPFDVTRVLGIRPMAPAHRLHFHRNWVVECGTIWHQHTIIGKAILNKLSDLLAL